MIIEAERVKVEALKLTDEEVAMGVVSATVTFWGRTTLVKFLTADNYEVVGMFTVGRYKDMQDSDPVRVTMARGNTMQRLQYAMERRHARAAEPRAVP